LKGSNSNVIQPDTTEALGYVNPKTFISDFAKDWSLTNPISGLRMEYVTVALLGKEMQLNEIIKGPNKTLNEAIRDGIFLNGNDMGATYDSEDLIIPRLSPLKLLCWINRKRKNAVAPAQQAFMNILGRMLRVEDDRIEGHEYEEFHWCWEIMWRFLVPDHPPPYLSSVFEKWTTNTKKPLKINYNWPSPHYDLKRNSNSILTNKEYFEYCVWIGGSNPGGLDIILLEQISTELYTHPIAIAIECRYAHPKSNTQLDKATIIKKRDKTLDSFKPYLFGTATSKAKKTALGSLGLRKEDIFQVFCTFAQLQADVHIDEKNTIIVNADKLRELYSPTFASFAQFGAERSAQAGTNAKKRKKEQESKASNEPPLKRQAKKCAGTAKYNNKPCQSSAMKGSIYCYQHKDCELLKK